MSQRIIVVVFAASVAASMIVSSSAGAAAPPSVGFESRAVVVTGLTPDGKFLLFGLANEEYRRPRRISHKASVFPVGENGEFRLDLPNRIPDTSVWVAADLESGECTVVAPRTRKAKIFAIPANALTRRGNGVRARLETGQDDHVLLYIRPGVGAWQLTGGRVSELQAMTPVDDSPEPPDDFRSGDFVVTVDPFSLVVRSIRVR